MVAWDDAAPESDISPALSTGGVSLLLEVRDGRGGRDRVERHIDEGGDATRGRSACPRPKAFPVCPSGLVQMDVRAGAVDSRRQRPWRVGGMTVHLLDKSWENILVSRIYPVGISDLREAAAGADAI